MLKSLDCLLKNYQRVIIKGIKNEDVIYVEMQEIRNSCKDLNDLYPFDLKVNDISLLKQVKKFASVMSE